MSEHPPDRSDEQTSEEETASLLANPEALRDLDAARDQIARGECVRGVDAVRALRPR